MAKIPQIRRLIAEDFAEQKAWIRPLFLVLNQFMETVVTGLNRTLTLKENMAADIITVTLSSVPSANSPLVVAWSLPKPPVALLIGNVTGTTLTTAASIQWAYETSLQITNLVGCTPTAAAPVTLTLVAFTG